MLKIIKNFSNNAKRVNFVALNSVKLSYHTYPDPNEKPQISSHKSDYKKQIDKKTEAFDLPEKFRLENPYPGIPIGKGIKFGSKPLSKTSKLSNGMTILTQEVPSLITSIVFAVKIGSSYENQNTEQPSNIGCTQILELNAFKSTKNRSALELINEIESLGGFAQCVSSRDDIIYCIEVLKENSEKAVEILADSILNSTFPEEELEESRAVANFQLEEIDAAVISKDLIQRAAYQGSPLGNHHFCPIERLNEVTKEKLMNFKSTYYFGENSFISATGIDHDLFVSLVEKKFSNFPSGNIKSIQRGSSKYVGGLLKLERQLKEPFVKVSLAFEVGGWQDMDSAITTCVIQKLLGGGSSFSAGGPGKGMYSKLFLEVLNREYWVESIEAFMTISDETGLLGIDCACPPEAVTNAIVTIVTQLMKLACVPVTDEELSRAKNMLKSSLMMNLESNLVLSEDLTRQYMTFGIREDPTLTCDKIDKVTKADIMNLTKVMLAKQPSIACVGHDLSHAPTYSDIQDFVKRFYAQNIKPTQ